MRVSLTVLSMLAAMSVVDCYRPLVLIRGIRGRSEVMKPLQDLAEKDFPGMKTFSLDAFRDSDSFSRLQDQVDVFARMVKEITDKYGDITLLGYSQGGLIARGVIEKSDNPHIHTFISLSSPRQ